MSFKIHETLNKCENKKELIDLEEKRTRAVKISNLVKIIPKFVNYKTHLIVN